MANSNKLTVSSPKNSGIFAHPKVGYPTVAVRMAAMNDDERDPRQAVG